MKRTIISIISIALIATLSTVCLTACGKKEDKKASETTASTVAATTAPNSSASSQSSNQSTTAAPADDAQSETASPEQESYMKQQKAIQKAIQKAVESAAQLYGQGEWGVASFEKQTSDAGTEIYYIGLVDYSNSQSPTYYFYVDGDNCSPDNKAAAPEGQEEQANKQKAVYSAVSKAEELYGEGGWGVSSCEQQTSSDGSTVYYIGVTNYNDSQAPTYYFYADENTCTPAE